MMRWGKTLCDGRVRRAKCAACQLHHSGVAKPLAIAAAAVPRPIAAIGRRIPGRLGTAIGMPDLIAHNQHVQREMLNLVDRFVVLSNWARDVLIANGAPPAKVALNRLGTRLTVPAVGARQSASPLTVAYIGRFDPIKGALDFARAIALVPRSAPIRFEFHGPVQFRSELVEVERLKASVGPEAWVQFGGELDLEGLRAALRRIDVICCPSRTVEGGPTIALEARAAGVPVIGSDIPALSELIDDPENGRLYPVGDSRALADILQELAVQPVIVERWRSRLPPVRTMDDVARDYLEVYAA
jgi:glycosyltransferase involved in cell wall biosynthesis